MLLEHHVELSSSIDVIKKDIRAPSIQRSLEIDYHRSGRLNPEIIRSPIRNCKVWTLVKTLLEINSTRYYLVFLYLGCFLKNLSYVSALQIEVCSLITTRCYLVASDPSILTINANTTRHTQYLFLFTLHTCSDTAL